MLRGDRDFSVWFTLKPSLIPVWWLPWVFAVHDLTPIVLTQSNFWAVFELPCASHLIMNAKREEELSEKTWLLETHILGQSSLSKPVLLGSPEIMKRRGEQQWESRTEKTKVKKKNLCAFQSSKDRYKLLLSKNVLLQFSSRIASKQSDYLVTYRVWQTDNVALSWWSSNGSFWRTNNYWQHSKWEFEALSVSSTIAVIYNDDMFYSTS